MAKDKELADHERAHSGVPGSKVRHGADATGQSLEASGSSHPHYRAGFNSAMGGMADTANPHKDHFARARWAAGHAAGREAHEAWVESGMPGA